MVIGWHQALPGPIGPLRSGSQTAFNTTILNGQKHQAGVTIAVGDTQHALNTTNLAVDSTHKIVAVNAGRESVFPASTTFTVTTPGTNETVTTSNAADAVLLARSLPHFLVGDRTPPRSWPPTCVPWPPAALVRALWRLL